MIANFQRILLTIAASLIAVDLIWGFSGHFRVDALSYGRLGLLSLGLVAGGLYYQKRRAEPALAASLFGTAFLCAFSAAASVLNYFLLTVAGPRIDDVLAAADRALGFNWYDIMVAMSHHVLLNEILFRIYNLVLPQIALVLVALAWSGRAEAVYRYCLALAIGALFTIAVWTLMPSFGAESVYILPPQVASKLILSVSTAYGKDLVALLQGGPGYITPSDVRGLIGFPSYHGALALILIAYAWPLRRLRWPVLILNILILISTPIQGGHHLVDVLASFPVAALSIWLASLGEKAQGAAILPVVVNKKKRFPARPVPQGFFRIDAEQEQTAEPSAIKAKLSGSS